MNAAPLACSACGRPVGVPARHEALLDEQGWANIPCDCGAINRVPFDTIPVDPGRKRRRPSWELVALWFVILGLIILLFPMIQRQHEPEPAPPSYLTT
ncbi:MAG: hypothetical protein ABIV13_00140 [Fimbriimonadales bacterium]